jgi:tRNA-splicing ligase RtcB
MSYTEVPGVRVPIRMWADPATVEDGAMQQLRNVSSLPWIKGLAVMPDVHYGKGATVGSVRQALRISDAARIQGSWAEARASHGRWRAGLVSGG